MRLLALVLAAFGAAPAFAQGLSAYIGVDVGVLAHDVPDPDSPFSDTVGAWKLFGGFQINDYIGFEAARGSSRSLGDDDGVGSPLNVGVHRLHQAHSVEFDLFTVKIKGFLPFEWGSLSIGYGYFNMDADAVWTAPSGDRGSISVGDDGEVATLGIDWRRFGRFDRSFDLRLEYEWFDFPFSNAETLTIGVAYRFGNL